MQSDFGKANRRSARRPGCDSMKIFLHMVNDSPIRLWGLSARERSVRVLRQKAALEVVDRLEDLPEGSSVLLLRGDYLLDNRVIHALAEARDTVLQAPSGCIAAHVPAALAETASGWLSGQTADPELPAGIRVTTAEAVCPAYQEQLLKADPPFALRITESNLQEGERLVFGAAYKGITDLVTKWVWPLPAQWGVRGCIRLALRPNHITTLNWLLAVLAGFLFWDGHFTAGLTIGWVMTYLDTVDGKLARVTVTSSKLGHLLDHVLDIVHPPLWYLAWGLGLGSYEPALLPEGIEATLWIILGAYIGGRLAEGGFQLWLGSFGIFCWRKVDSYSRLITARRNPCLILLTAGNLAARPDLGLEAVALWTLASSLFLLVRLAMAGYTHAAAGPLSSWLTAAGQDPRDRSLAVRWFARGTRIAAVEPEE